MLAEQLLEEFNLAFWINLGISVALFIVILVFMIRIKPHISIIIIYSSLMTLFILSEILRSQTVTLTITIILIIFLFIFTMANIHLFRDYFLANYKKKAPTLKKIRRSNGILIYDREALVRKIYDTVAYCSKNKIGALMTFEKNIALDGFLKSGTAINAPVSQELLLTIFYPGTRLHDGAVIIRGDVIKAASVYYTPTTKALTGKYGSRHRAAIGISEVCDAITVVVSEETGRISIAHESEIEPVQLDNFVRTFEDLLIEKPVQQEGNK